MTRPLFILILAVTAATACDRTQTREAIPEDAWEVNNFVYQIQGANVTRIGETEFDLVITTIDAAGNSSATIPALKRSPGGDKTVLAYMSIGQAEDYRYYWDPAWEEELPSWLAAADDTWHGDHWVRYWETGWRDVIFGAPDAYLDRIIELGFDGIYLDRIDAYLYFEEEERRTTAAEEMVGFVLDLADYARDRRPGFGVFPQNEAQLGVLFPEYLDTVTGIGVEDLYYGAVRDHQPSPPEWTKEREANLRAWVEADKLVLTTDYTAVPEQISDAYRRSIENGFTPNVTDRSLSRIRINEGFEPSRDPHQYEHTKGK